MRDLTIMIYNSIFHFEKNDYPLLLIYPQFVPPWKPAVIDFFFKSQFIRICTEDQSPDQVLLE